MGTQLFQIKICGVTTVDDAELSLLAGADAVGLNFCAASKRRVEPAAAAEIAQAVRALGALVGVFVDSPIAEVQRIAGLLDLDYVQLHGDESPESCAALAGRGVIKAFRFRPERTEDIDRFLDRCGNRRPDAILLDAYHEAAHGGTGRTADWPAVAVLRQRLGQMPVILAGGLHHENVGRAIGIARPAGVDTASGVESSPRKKDPDRVRRFVSAARQALADCATVD